MEKKKEKIAVTQDSEKPIIPDNVNRCIRDRDFPGALQAAHHALIAGEVTLGEYEILCEAVSTVALEQGEA